MANPLMNLMVKTNMPIASLKAFLGKGGSPKNLIMQALKGKASPEVTKLIEMAKSNNMNGIKEYATEVFKKQGRDFDKEFAEFMNNFK